MILIIKDITKNTVRFCPQSLRLQKKKMHFDKLILKSTNKSETTWNIVKSITNNRNTTNNIATMNINKNLTSNPLGIANAFNAYFSSVAENLVIKNLFGKNSTNNNDPLTY
jgi:hypothetical protein